MNFIFIVQGEGRGHLTQAISLFELLHELGHTVSAVCIGTSSRRTLPAYVKEKLNCPLYLIESPNFVTDKKHKGVLIGKTILHNLSKSHMFMDSLRKIHKLVSKYQPDVILNFYDLLGGIYNSTYRPSCQYWVIGHQYLSLHQDFPFSKGDFIAKWLFKTNTWLTSIGADQYLALSFRDLPKSPMKNFHVFPPLLRNEIKKLQTSYEDYFLVYMVNPGYHEEVTFFAKKYPHLNLEVFWDKQDAPDFFRPLPNVIFYKVNDGMFLKKMALCRGFVSTAGFESICEAMYLEKPVMMIPVKGHYEQACNAEDAKLANAGIQSDKFDFGALQDYLQEHEGSVDEMKTWQNQFKSKMRKLLIETTPQLKENHQIPSYYNKGLFVSFEKSTN